MKVSHDPHGDVPIDLNRYQFRLGEVAFLARVAPQTIHNWRHRGIVTIGKKIKGQTWFSLLDTIRLTVVHDLCARQVALVPLHEAAMIAEAVVKYAVSSTHPDAYEDGIKPNVSILVAWTETGQTVAQVHDIKAPGHYYPPHQNEDGYEPLRRAHLVIPATAILIDVVTRTEALWAKKGALQDA